MNNMNMDNKENQDAEMPVMEFTLPANELDAMVKVGQKGEVMIPVEVIATGDNSVTLRKIGAASADKHFQDVKDMPAMEMRKHMKVLDSNEITNPFKDKQEK
jgi:hypothetical protein